VRALRLIDSSAMVCAESYCRSSLEACREVKLKLTLGCSYVDVPGRANAAGRRTLKSIISRRCLGLVGLKVALPSRRGNYVQLEVVVVERKKLCRQKPFYTRKSMGHLRDLQALLVARVLHVNIN
jgi:hypothetical protein